MRASVFTLAFCSEDYRLSKDNRVDREEKTGKRTDANRWIAGQVALSKAIGCTKQSIAQRNQQFNTFSSSRCCHGRIEEL
jgi:hypothetical protein